MVLRLRIANGTLVTSRGLVRGDVVCRDGTIERIGETGDDPVDEQIDARRLLVFPGFLDPRPFARLYGLHPRKGAIQTGADADFTLVDPEATTTIDSSRLHS